MATSDSELSRTAWRSITASNQPVRRRRPVLVPNSWPRSTRRSPTSSNSSVGNGPGADPRAVGLGDADDPVDVARADAGAGARAAGHRVRRRDEGIRAVVEVEERGLRALEQHVLAGLERLVHQADGVGDVRLEPRRELAEVAVGDLVGRRAAGGCRPWPGRRSSPCSTTSSFCPEDLRVEQVLHPQADAQRLVGVGRADAPPGGAELVAPRWRSVRRSSSWWYGRIRWALPLTPAGGCSRRPWPSASRSRRAARRGRRRRRCR